MKNVVLEHNISACGKMPQRLVPVLEGLNPRHGRLLLLHMGSEGSMLLVTSSLFSNCPHSQRRGRMFLLRMGLKDSLPVVNFSLCLSSLCHQNPSHDHFFFLCMCSRGSSTHTVTCSPYQQWYVSKGSLLRVSDSPFSSLNCSAKLRHGHQIL